LIGCPKLDDGQAYVEKLAAILTTSDVYSVTIVHMEVPCCTGLVRIAEAAVQRSGRNVPLKDVTISIRGQVTGQEPADANPLQIAGLFEDGGRCRFGWVYGQRRFAAEDASSGGVAPSILAGDEGVASRCAGGASGVGIGETDAFTCKLVAMRCFDDLRAVTAEVTITDVVRLDVDDIRSLFGRRAY